MNHLQENTLISKQQHGFVPGRSTVTQLLETMDSWTDILEDGGSIDVIYMDYQKAFDSVPHRRLIQKIKALGVDGKVLEWIKDFLSGRSQKVIINATQSHRAEVTSGIPQGSVLGPILFVMFINDLPHVVKSEVKMFADDTKLYGRSDNDQGIIDIQDDLDQLQAWSDRWLLRFHPQKCAVMKLGNKKSTATYSMPIKSEYGSKQRLTLSETTSEKDLGVWVDNTLYFRNHVAQITGKANKVIGIIRRSFDYLNEPMFIQLYKALVRPLLEYGHCVWQPLHKTLCSNVEDVQRRATKLLGSLRDKTYQERLKTLRLPTLEHRRLRGDMIELYKYIHGFYHVQSPRLLLSSGRTVRGHSLKLQKNRYRLDIRGNFFGNRTVNTWNSLPEKVVTAPTVDTFKSRLDQHWKDLPSLYDPDCQN